MKYLRLIVGVAIAMLLAGPAETFAADAANTNVTVEVLIFSGRRNPTWELQDTKALEKLKLKLKDLPEASAEEPGGWRNLGFQGFRIWGGESLGLPAQIRIYQGVVSTGHGKAAKYLKDLTRLEQSLIEESKRQPLEPGVRDAITNYERARKASN